MKSSLDSIVPSEEEDLERRGSRGPRLSDLLQIQERRKKKQRYKDKQGFTWRPFVPDEELPTPRPPQPHLRSNGDISKPPTTSDVPLIRQRPGGDVSLQFVATDVGQQEKENNSENSYKTAHSDQESFIPKQVSDSYKKPSNETCALERKSSVRAIQEHQYRSLPQGLRGEEAGK